MNTHSQATTTTGVPVAAYAALIMLAALIVAGCGDAQETDMDMEQADTMEGMQEGAMGMGEGYVPDTLSRVKLAPLVKAYYDGGELFFIHTEVSDRAIADTLTVMMGPDVLTVPELAQAPAALTSPIYVFENGVEGMGPLGYQPDVFPSAPGDDDYRPLRTIYLVRWNENATPGEIRSAEAIEEGERAGNLTIENSGIVVNAPVLAWPGGTR